MSGEKLEGQGRPEEALERFLAALYGRARPGLLVELRVRAGAGMAQHFVPVERRDERARFVLARGALTDVYVGVLPRWRARGRRRDVAGGAQVVWADCDGEEAAEALRAFGRRPSMVVRSGNIRSRLAWSRSASGVGRWRHVADVAGYSGRRGRGCAMARAEGGRS